MYTLCRPHKDKDKLHKNPNMCYFFLKHRGFKDIKDIIFPPVQPFVCQQDQTMWWLSQQSLTGSISILRTFLQSYILVHICFSIPPTHPWQFLLSQQPTGFFSLFNLRRNPENWPNTRNTRRKFSEKVESIFNWSRIIRTVQTAAQWSKGLHLSKPTDTHIGEKPTDRQSWNLAGTKFRLFYK